MKKAMDTPTSTFVIENSSASDKVHGVLKIQQHLPHWSTEVTLCSNWSKFVASESFLKTQWLLLKQYPDVLLRVTLESGGESQIAGFSVQRQITALPRHLHAENLNKNEWIGCSPLVTV